MNEKIETIPFRPPSQELLELLRDLEESSQRISRIAAWSYWQCEELRGLGELSALQTDALLSGRTR